MVSGSYRFGGKKMMKELKGSELKVIAGPIRVDSNIREIAKQAKGNRETFKIATHLPGSLAPRP